MTTHWIKVKTFDGSEAVLEKDAIVLEEIDISSIDLPPTLPVYEDGRAMVKAIITFKYPPRKP